MRQLHDTHDSKIKASCNSLCRNCQEKKLQKQISSYISNKVGTPQFDTGFPPFMTIHPWCERDKALQHNVKLGHYYIKTMQSEM